MSIVTRRTFWISWPADWSFSIDYFSYRMFRLSLRIIALVAIEVLLKFLNAWVLTERSFGLAIFLIFSFTVIWRDWIASFLNVMMRMNVKNFQDSLHAFYSSSSRSYYAVVCLLERRAYFFWLSRRRSSAHLAHWKYLKRNLKILCLHISPILAALSPYGSLFTLSFIFNII